MSSSKFDEKRRVAHTATTVNSSLLGELSCKKASIGQIMNRINGSKQAGPSLQKGKAGGAPLPKRSRKDTDEDGDFYVSEEEEEFIDDEDEEEDDDDFDMGLSDDETPKKRKRVAPVKNGSAKAKNGVIVANGIRPVATSTLSDSDDGEGQWLSKPRLAGAGAQAGNRMMTSKAIKKQEAPKEKKKIVIWSSEEEEEDEKAENGERKFPEEDLNLFSSKPASSFRFSSTPEVDRKKSSEKKGKKEKKKKRGLESEFEEEEDGDGGSGDDAKHETDSEASDAEERVSGRVRNLRDGCLVFFNTATQESLLAAPRVTDKIAEHVMEKRPFQSYAALEQSLSSIPRCSGRGLLDAYIEHLENRGVLERILEDCRVHSEDVAEETQKKIKLMLLNPEMTLHEYQQAGVEWLALMHSKNLNSILADEMGLGKTIQIVAFLSYLKQEKVRGPHLIVVPSSTIENWMTEMKKWCPALKLMTYYGTQQERKQIRHAAKRKKESVDVLLTTYNMIGSRSDDRKFFKNFSINYVVYDEGHMLKNCQTERYKSLIKIKSQRKVLLTGTPLQNNLIELISLMYFTMTRIFTRYCEDITQLLGHFKQQRPALEGTDALLYQEDRIEQAKAILQPYILRRVKSQVLSELPPKTEETVEVEMLPDQEDLYLDVVDSLKNDDGDASNAYGGLMRLRQAANHPLLRRKLYEDNDVAQIAKTLVKKEKAYEKKKAEYVAEDLEILSDFALHQLCEKFPSCHKYLLEEKEALNSGKVAFLDQKLPEIQAKGDKVLIFSQFTSMLDILEVYLKARGFAFSRLDGSTPVLERLPLIDAFNSSTSSFIFLLSTRAGGLGINLVSANHIIIHDIDFNPYNDKQAEDRCHRMGQKKPVHVIRLVAKGTIEVDIHRLARKKLKLEKDVTEGSRGLASEEVSAAEAKKLLASAMRSPAKQRRNSDAANNLTPS